MLASAAAASSRAVATLAPARPRLADRDLASLFPPRSLVDRDEAADQGDDECDGDGGELDAQPAVRPRLTLDALSAASCCSRSRSSPAGVEELALRFRQRRRPDCRRRRGRPRAGPRDTARPGRGRARPSPPPPRAAARASTIASRSSSIQRRRRGHSRSRASWASSTVGTRVWGWRSRVSRRACAHRSIAASIVGPATSPDSSARAARRRVGSPSAPTTTSRSNIRRTAARSSSSSDEYSSSAREAIAPSTPPSSRYAASVSALVRTPLGQLEERELQRRKRGRLVDDGADQLGDQRPLDRAPDALGGLDDGRFQLGRRHRRRWSPSRR